MTAYAGAPATFSRYEQSIYELVMSNPFVRGNPVAQGGPPGSLDFALTAPTLAQKAAFIDGLTGASISYARLRKDSLRFASYLRNQLGLKPSPYTQGGIKDPILSPVVLVHLPNSIPFVVSELGTWAAGLTVTTVNFAYRATELSHIIQSSKPSLILTLAGKDGYDEVQEALRSVDKAAQSNLKNRIYTIDLNSGDYGLSTPGSTVAKNDWKNLLDKEGSENNVKLPVYDTKSEENKRRCALILWSSGTTGKSKGVVISHAYLTSNIQAVWFSCKYRPDEVFLGLPPFFHVFGLSVNFLTSVAAGYTNILISKFDPRLYLSLMQQYRATHLHIAAPVGVILAKADFVSNYDFSSVRAATSGGAPLSSLVIEQVWKRLGFLIRMGYGTSEHAGSTQTYPWSWDDLGSAVTASGRAYLGTEIKIMSIDGKQTTLNIDDEGEICIRSGSLMNCYLNNPEATAESLTADGWNRTGDIGKLDKDGNLYITDRLKELIKVKGFQVPPAELEAILNGEASVADAGVTSIYVDEEATEYPVAYVVPRDERIVDACRKAGKATPEVTAWAHGLKKVVEQKTIEYKHLRGGLNIVAVLPKSNAGKLLRKDFKSIPEAFHVQLYVPKRRGAAKL